MDTMSEMRPKDGMLVQMLSLNQSHEMNKKEPGRSQKSHRDKEQMKVLELKPIVKEQLCLTSNHDVIESNKAMACRIPKNFHEQIHWNQV
ncbi:hypothetical protein [Streptococcus sp. S784/96/1]|uniref:hypothetical protein n=1 Tax=Streptococcus sp. S784/96/1 TaxID=2653499 RepID=UPI001386CB0F|nr:hypothetical protein [Streptococcus sp. S784/96/1]